MNLRKTTVLIIFILQFCYAYSIQMQNSVEDFYTELTYEWVNEKIIIPVVIGNRTYRFILDTGAITLISKELSDSMEVLERKKLEVSDANGNKSSLNQILIPKIKIGNASFDNTISIINKDDSNLLFSCFKIDGLIGSNLFKNSILQILPKVKKIRITNIKNRINLSQKNSINIELSNQGLPYILLKLSGNKKAKGYALLDTGMKGFFDLSNDNFTIYQKRNLFDVNSSSFGFKGGGLFGIEEYTKYQRMVLPEMSISSVKFENINIETTNGKSSRIGTEILKYGNLTIDFINKKLYFNSEKDRINLSEKVLGFTPTLLDGKLIIGLIWDQGLKDKINVGDQIIDINGIDFTDYFMCDMIIQENIFTTSDKFEIKLKNKKGEIKTITTEKTTANNV